MSGVGSECFQERMAKNVPDLNDEFRSEAWRKELRAEEEYEHHRMAFRYFGGMRQTLGLLITVLARNS